MNKKFLSAILFGALMVSVSLTFHLKCLAGSGSAHTSL